MQIRIRLFRACMSGSKSNAPRGRCGAGRAAPVIYVDDLVRFHALADGKTKKVRLVGQKKNVLVKKFPKVDFGKFHSDGCFGAAGSIFGGRTGH
jgi:hypothetical protein